MSFANPYLFLLLLIIPVYLFFRYFRKGEAGLPITLGKKKIPRTLRSSLRFIPEMLIIMAFFFLIVALARPQKITQFSSIAREGIAIEMVIDRSSSMGAPVQGTEGNRLDLVKSVFRDFLMGDGKDLQGRPNDLVGLISFARYADTQAPLTLAHNVLQQFIQTTDLVTRQEEDGTSLGDAIALAAARLHDADQRDEVEYTIKSKVIILLTDGISNMGNLTPMEAAEIAAQWDIKIYVIGFRENSLGQMLLGLGGYGREGEVLEEMAKLTGGRFFEATNPNELREVYQVIDQLEPSKVESLHNQQVEELFSFYLYLALLSLFISIFLKLLLFRRMPL